MEELILAQTPISWERASALTSIRTPSSALRRKASTGPKNFGQPDVFVPMANEASLDGVDWLESRRDRMSIPIVRIKDGVTMPQVQAELDTIAARMPRQYPKEEEKLTFKLTRPGLMGDFSARRRALFWLACWGWQVLCCSPPAPTSAACSQRVPQTAPARLPSAWPLGRAASPTWTGKS